MPKSPLSVFVSLLWKWVSPALRRENNERRLLGGGKLQLGNLLQLYPGLPPFFPGKN